MISISNDSFLFWGFFFFCLFSRKKQMKMEGLLLAQVCGAKGKVLANGTRNFPLDTYRDTHNSRSEQQQQRIKLPARGIDQPLSFLFLFLSQVKRTKGGLQTSSCFTTTMGPFFFLLCVDLSPPSKESWKKNKNPARERERDNNTIGFAIYYSTTTRVRGWSGFYESTLKERKESCKDINSSR